MVVLGAVVAAAPAHSAHAHLPLSRHVAAASSFSAPVPVPAHLVAAQRRRIARSAADSAVTIADFHFTPPTATIHVGETITWTNDGPSSHTATAKDGSFNTGTLSKGQSASHTFTRAGTYAYVCTIHPFMHGTITVLEAGTTPPTPPPTSSTPAPVTTTTKAPASTITPAPTTSAATPARAATAKPTLPVTGTDVVGAIVVGAVLVGSGLALRQAVRA